MSATNGTTQAAPIVGAVEDANDRGVRIAGQWLNLSKFGPPVELPGRGQLVSVTVDPKGFIRGCKVLSGADAAPAIGGHLPTVPGLDDDLGEPDFGPIVSWRDRSIIRQSSAKTAFAFAESRPDMRAADAIHLAELIERWVTRS